MVWRITFGLAASLLVVGILVGLHKGVNPGSTFEQSEAVKKAIARVVLVGIDKASPNDAQVFIVERFSAHLDRLFTPRRVVAYAIAFFAIVTSLTQLYDRLFPKKSSLDR